MKILDTTESNLKLQTIKSEAKEYLILISPFIRMNPQSLLSMQKTFKRLCFSYVIRKSEHPKYPWDNKDRDNHDFLNKAEKCEYGILESLHAKIYMNEKECLITSCNMNDSTNTFNYEAGVYFKKADFPEEYRDVETLALDIINASDVNDKSFAELLAAKSLSMGSLYNKLTTGENFANIKKRYSSLDKLYRDLCQEAMKLRAFEDEYFQKSDGNRLYRHTPITIGEFALLYNSFK